MLKRFIGMILTVCMILSILTVTAFADTVTVDIVSFKRGAQADLRSSELLEARVTGYSGNVRELTYKWYNRIGTYLYVYNSHNMYGINNTEGEIEIYNNTVSTSENMKGYSYKDSFTGTGYAWAAIYGANLSNEALVGTVTVEVYDANGNLIATDTHEGTREKTGSWFFATYEYHGFVNSSLSEDVKNIAFGIFEDDTKKVKDLLGESAIIHVTCVECDVPTCTIASGNDVISVTKLGDDFAIKGLKKGTGAVNIKIEKSNCKFHQNVSTSTNVTVYVYEKPITTPQTTSITLDNLDPDCTYYINGVQGVKQADGTLIFDGLTPNTTYEIEVIGYTEGTKPVYAYVYETTLPVYPAKVEVYLNGGMGADGIPYGTAVNIDKILGNGAKIYLRKLDTNEYFELTNTKTGVYETTLSAGDYSIYSAPNSSSQVCDQLFTITDIGRTRELFFYTVSYDANGGTYSGDAIEYHHENHHVHTTDILPVKEGYDFKGWKDTDGTVYQADELLTGSIFREHKLVAQWEKSKYANVNLTLVIDHTATSVTGDSGSDPNPEGNLDIELAYRLNASEPYVEYVGKSETYTNWYETGVKNGDITTVTYPGIFTSLPNTHEYSTTVFLEDYQVVDSSVNAITDAEGNTDYNVTIHLKFNPELFNLQYNIVADSSVPDELIPQAVDIKVLSWNANVRNKWAPISRHEEYSSDVLFNSTDGRHGSGSYGVPVYKNENEKYYYRVASAGFTLADGTEVTANSTDGINFYSDEATEYGKGAFYAVISVEGGADVDSTDLDGAYGIYASGDLSNGYVQQGKITVTVYVNQYDVIFDSQGGSSVETIKDCFTVPEVLHIKPVKDGYTFSGWYKDASCTTGNEVVAGEVLTSDITLYAKWIENRTIKGTVTVAGFYTLDGNIHSIPVNNRLMSEKLLVQRIDGNGYFVTIGTYDVPITYNGDYGSGTFEFKNIPNDDTSYRIKILSSSYEAKYQNELSSSTVVTDYSAYDDTHYTAEFVSDTTAVANAFLSFNPVTFDLKFEIDASALGSGYRPESVETLILCDEGSNQNYPQSWITISQMVKNGDNVGLDISLTDGKGMGSYPVWEVHPDSKTLYGYAIKVDSYTLNGEEKTYDSSLPFGIYYNGSARYDEANGQTQMLTATFVPKLYNIIYDMGDVSEQEEITGMNEYQAIDGTFVDSYYWSYGKIITAQPKRVGYHFAGWYDASGNPVSVITPDMAENVTLHAKWTQGVSFETLADAGYYSQERASADKIGVISLNAFINEFDSVKDSIVAYGIYVYNNPASEVKATAECIESDKLIESEGKFHAIISNISQDKFGMVVHGIPYIVLDTDGDKSTTDDLSTITGTIFSTSVSSVNKWLGAVNEY